MVMCITYTEIRTIFFSLENTLYTSELCIVWQCSIFPRVKLSRFLRKLCYALYEASIGA